MDPIAHTLTGAALSGAGLRRVTPLATATLVLAANAPDVDILAYFASDEYGALAFRRGWTHGVAALAAWPFVLTGGALAYDRAVRRRRDPDARPARAAPLFLLALIGVLTHPFLDWLNNYGLRWLMPFDGRWFYGDALFIVDPWVWLVLGGVLFLAYSRTALGIVAWALAAAAASVLMLGTPLVPPAAKALWLLGLGLLIGLRAVRYADRLSDPARVVAWGLAAVAAYVVLIAAADPISQRVVRAELAARGIGPVQRVMVAPVPANPFAGQVVAETPGAYHHGRFAWLGSPRLELWPEATPRRPPDPVTRAAAGTREARDYLLWARFPFYVVEERPDGFRVTVSDARYAGMPGAGSLRGVTILLDRDLRPIERGDRSP